MANEREIGAMNVKKFHEWSAEREAAGDSPDYIRQGNLYRTEVAAEYGFPLTASITQHPTN